MCKKDNCNDNYNGWSNYETWLVSLWLNNDEQTLSNAKNRISKKTGWGAEIAIKDYICDICAIELPNASLANDLLNSAINNIDWSEIVQSINNEG